MKHFVGALLIFGLSASVTAQTEWVNVASSDTAEYDIQAGSLEELNTKGGIPIATVIGRTTRKSTKRIELSKWYVSFKDCDRTLGKIVTLDVDGKYQFESDFVFGGGNIASALSEMICGSLKKRVEAREQKGI